MQRVYPLICNTIDRVPTTQFYFQKYFAICLYFPICANSKYIAISSHFFFLFLINSHLNKQGTTVKFALPTPPRLINNAKQLQYCVCQQFIFGWNWFSWEYIVRVFIVTRQRIVISRKQEKGNSNLVFLCVFLIVIARFDMSSEMMMMMLAWAINRIVYYNSVAKLFIAFPFIDNRISMPFTRHIPQPLTVQQVLIRMFELSELLINRANSYGSIAVSQIVSSTNFT